MTQILEHSGKALHERNCSIVLRYLEPTLHQTSVNLNQGGQTFWQEGHIISMTLYRGLGEIILKESNLHFKCDLHKLT